MVPSPAGKVFKLSHMTLVSSNGLQKRLTSVQEEAVNTVEELQKLEVDSDDDRLKLKKVKDQKKRLTDAEQKAVAACLGDAETKDELGKVAQKWNEIEDWLSEIEDGSRFRLIRLNIILVRQAHMDKMQRGVIEPLVSVFDYFIGLHGCKLVNAISVGLRKAYSDNMVVRPASLTRVSVLVPAACPGERKATVKFKVVPLLCRVAVLVAILHVIEAVGRVASTLSQFLQWRLSFSADPSSVMILWCFPYLYGYTTFVPSKLEAFD